MFGTVPAFDTFFLRGFRIVTGIRVTFGRSSLRTLDDFYRQQAQAIDSQRLPTVDGPGRRTPWCYTRAKVIDMAFLIEGGGA